MSRFWAGPAGVVGKLPTRAEYLPVPTSAPAFAAFDGWLTEAAEWAVGRAGAGWEQAFADGSMHGFVFQAPGAAADELLCGAITPSADSAGRQFPLALAAPLRLSPELVAHPQLLPFMLEELWAEATQVLLGLRAGQDIAAQLSGSASIDVNEAAQLYADWSAQLPVTELWTLLGPALVDPEGSLRLLLETLAPVRGVERPQTMLSLRLPLGLVGGAALCVWLDIIRKVAGWKATVPSLFWSHDGTTGAALVHLGRPPRAALAELWLPSGQRDEVADLTAPPAAALVDVLAPLPAQLLPLLHASNASVAHLLQALTAASDP